MAAQLKTVLFYTLGICALSAASLAAITTWGVFTAFYLLPSARGVSALVFQSFIGALVAAIPFGLLFGLLVARRTAVKAALVAFVASSIIVGFVAWVGLLVRPTWWVTPLDALFFVALFPLFASFSHRLTPTPSAAVRNTAATTFMVLAALYYFGPILYFSYAYTPKV